MAGLAPPASMARDAERPWLSGENRLCWVIAFVLWTWAAFHLGSLGSTPPPQPTSMVTIIEREPKSATHTMLNLPSHVTQVVINVGPHKDPLLPSGSHQVVIALEASPFTACWSVENLMPNHPGLYMISAAGGARFEFRLFNEVNTDVASSLLEPKHPSVDTRIKRQSLVPVIPLEALLNAIPSHILVPFIKIDAQGWDIEVVKGAGEALHRVCWLQCETQTTNESIKIYGNPENHFSHHIEMLKPLGFTLQQIRCHDNLHGKYPFTWPPVPRVDAPDTWCSHDFNSIFLNTRDETCKNVPMPSSD